jgi:hypothetical protein
LAVRYFTAVARLRRRNLDGKTVGVLDRALTRSETVVYGPLRNVPA